MNRTELDQDIDNKITNKTELDSITPAEDGANRKLMLDYVDIKTPFKSWIAKVNPSSVVSVFKNEIAFDSPTISNPSNGKVRITKTNFFQLLDSAKIDVITYGTINNGGQAYVLSGKQSDSDPFNSVDIDIFNMVGEQLSTPNTNFTVEIRVYN